MITGEYGKENDQMEEKIELDVKELGKLLWKRAWIILLCAVIAASAMFLYTKAFVSPMYEAQVMIYINSSPDRESVGLTTSDLTAASRLVGTYVNIMKSNAVLEEVIAKSGVKLAADQIREMLFVEMVEETEVFWVSVISPNPQMSADIVNTIADIAPEKIVQIIEGSSAKVIDYAQIPTEQCYPNYGKNSAIGGAVGAVAAVLGIAIYMLLDRRIKTEEDLMKIYAIPVLGKIPEMDPQQKKNGKARKW